MARGGRITGAHPALARDVFFARYGWSYPQYLMAPEWLLEEQASVILGEAEGVKARTSSAGGSSYGADMRSAAEIAQTGGLPPPPGGWGNVNRG